MLGSVWIAALTSFPSPAAERVVTPMPAVIRSVRLASGTPVRLRLQKSVSSHDASPSERVEFSVAEEVSAGGIAAIPKGSRAWGIVAEASPRGRMGKSGKLAINIEGVCAADGTPSPLRAVNAANTPGLRRSKSDSGLADSLFALPAWPVLLFMLGKERTLPAGTEVTAYVDRDQMIDPSLVGKRSPDGPCGTLLDVASSEPAASMVNVRSDPAGADITIDGKYVGGTPSRLRLAPGQHHVVIGMRGRLDWERTLTVETAGEITMSAVLEPAPQPAGSRVAAAQ
jgi:hypothetical protein